MTIIYLVTRISGNSYDIWRSNMDAFTDIEKAQLYIAGLVRKDKFQQILFNYTRKLQEQWEKANPYSPNWSGDEVEEYYNRQELECAAKFAIKFPSVKYYDAVRFYDDEYKYEIKEVELH
jgi:hypothetical protein